MDPESALHKVSDGAESGVGEGLGAEVVEAELVEVSVKSLAGRMCRIDVQE